MANIFENSPCKHCQTGWAVIGANGFQDSCHKTCDKFGEWLKACNAKTIEVCERANNKQNMAIALLQRAKNCSVSNESLLNWFNDNRQEIDLVLS